MKILSIETSCDETAVSLVEAQGGLAKPDFVVLGNSLYSQIALHREYGGVYPNLAKREHGKNLTSLLVKTLTEGGFISSTDTQNDSQNNPKIKTISDETWETIRVITSKEHDLYDTMRAQLEHVQKPDIDMIAVTYGPGLEPALWVGISFAEALRVLWDIPVVPTNHMEGHITSVLLNATNEGVENSSLQFPALALLISGGHTELVAIETWGSYAVIGQTRDDAVGEAFDKVARLLELPYPGGPEISRLAQTARDKNLEPITHLPRPMIHSNDLDFSFSGLKTAVLYFLRDYTRDHGPLTPDQQASLACEFEDAVIETLVHKTTKALMETGAQTLIVAGGVIANTKIREACTALSDTLPGLIVKIPTRTLATDNSVMIAIAGYIQATLHPELLTNPPEKIIAKGNLKLGGV